MNDKLKGYSYSALGQSILDIAIKVGATAVITLLNGIVAATTNGSIQLPYPALLTPLLGLLVSQLDSYFVQWTGPQA